MSGHAARIARDHCLAPGRVDAPVHGGRYRSLFADLPPLRADEAALHALGAPGGPCDFGAGAAGKADARSAAVWPFFGQFVAHDITADRSPLVHRAVRDGLRNARAPRADLEGLYGAGPVGVPYLYRADDPAKLLLGPGGCDVPRNHEGIALIGDPRNDVHLFTSQMTVAFIALHNRLVDRLREDGIAEDDLFAEARRATTWHYQHVILREYLPGLVGAELTAELLARGPRWYRVDGDPAIPFEFADAAYRYGHAQIRDRYRVLWLYVLKEADVLHDGEQLGPVGGRIVGEVLVGIIDGDPVSFRSVDPGWIPTLPARGPAGFGLADILVPAG